MPRKRNSSSITREERLRESRRFENRLRSALLGGDYNDDDDGGEGEDNRRRVWYPSELQRQDTLVELYQDASSESSDLIFSIENNIFKVHKSILSLRVKELHKIVEDCDPYMPFSIDSVKPEIFKSVLDFAYTVKTPEIRNEGFATDLLIAADCYDCVHLKLFVESVLVDKFLKAENAASLLLFADSHNCALLKEAAVKLFLAEAETVKKTEGWSGIRQSNRLLEEMLDSVLFSNKTGGNCNNDIEHLDVGNIRDELQEANLPLDGSREVLVNRLKEHRQALSSAFREALLNGLKECCLPLDSTARIPKP